MLAVKRQQGCAPFLQLSVNSRFELLIVRFVKSGVRRIESGKRLRDMLRNSLRDDRIDGEMRITERMHVTGGPCDVCGYVHEANSLRCLDPPRLADLDLRVPRILQKRWQPAEFQLCAAVNQNIGIAHRNHEAWSRINEVWIFRGLRQNSDVDFVTTNFARQRSEV